MDAGFVAALPMYDFPWTADAQDALWRALAGELRRAGVPAPRALTSPPRCVSVSTRSPAGFATARVTRPRCPEKTRSDCPDATSHSLAVRSREAVTTRDPSPTKRTSSTPPV